ncbi:hypothetical protein JCM17844_19730 [Iodidimonas gelatinilytica]|uniref:N-acetyltransferase domain-containing protein n=2 Tax=Iodidimonas gelatinilytica TaxID=1236966 RepID=A0A5A7N319_9PROT|nr:hypothetical protein JCM17844_19730 [Iodidimonas gelatinilytica]GER02085.1 hypothetical protein JCM17845_27080 [Iodidimonas gelatinilytica]
MDDAHSSFMTEGLANIIIRDGAPEDTDQVIGLIGRCFAAYPGCVLDLPGLDADLPRICDIFARQKGRFWVAERAGAVLGCIGYVPSGQDVVELKRLYVDASTRRSGLATALLDLVLHAAQSVHATRIDLWSDTRFVEAHAFYHKHGFVMPGQMRDLHDPSNTTEYLFQKRL